jgi:hypothetical protein
MHVIGTGLEAAAVILLAVLGRAVFTYFSPYRECRWCRPGGLLGGSLLARIGGREPRPKRKARCWRCKRTKLTRRLGAKQVHKVKLSLQQAWEERGAAVAGRGGGDW